MRPTGKGDLLPLRHEAFVRPESQLQALRESCRSFSGVESCSALGLSEVGDLALWYYAKTNGFAIMSQDADFAEMAALLRPSPKVIWLRAGNQPSGDFDIAAASCRSHSGIREGRRRNMS
jgi:predicted nuclease of predicted toxin-antitoxin system